MERRQNHMWLVVQVTPKELFQHPPPPKNWGSMPCDEEFRFVQWHIRDTVCQLVKTLIKEKNPTKSETIHKQISEQIV